MNNPDETSSCLIIFGDRTAEEIYDVVQEVMPTRFDHVERVFFQDEIQAIKHCRLMESKSESVFFIVGVLDAVLRKRICQFSIQRGFQPFSVIHPTAYIACSSSIGKGVFVAPLSVVSSQAIVGDHVMIHYQSSVGHDCKLEPFSSVLPGAKLSGDVTVGEGAMIGSGSFVYQGLAIGNYAKIDALTYVAENVPNNRIVSCRL